MEKHTTPMLFPIEPDLVWEKISELVRIELKRAQTNNTPAVVYDVPGFVQKPIFKAQEVCAMLQVSRQTLHTWAKEGILRCYKIKSRSFYLWQDIEKLIKKEVE